jgi:hypothetical protein
MIWSRVITHLLVLCGFDHHELQPESGVPEIGWAHALQKPKNNYVLQLHSAIGTMAHLPSKRFGSSIEIVELESGQYSTVICKYSTRDAQAGQPSMLVCLQDQVWLGLRMSRPDMAKSAVLNLAAVVHRWVEICSLVERKKRPPPVGSGLL